MAEEKQFAYGDWCIEGVDCPVSSASLTNATNADLLGDDFDDRVQTRFNLGSEGVISYSQAEEVWDSLIDTYRRQARENDEESTSSEYYENLYQLAKEVQSKVFTE